MKLKIPMLLLGCMASSIILAGNIRLDSYAIEKRALPTAMEVADAAGSARPFTAVYLVKIKGVIPTGGALPVQLFVGDMPIREYGATKDGIYFKVYDPQVLRQMHGKPFRFAAGAQAARQSALIFNAPSE